MVEFIDMTHVEEEAYRNSLLLDRIYIQAKNISALKKDVPPVICRSRNKQLEALFSLRKYNMFIRAGDVNSAKAYLAEAESATAEAKEADKDLQHTLERNGYEYNKISLALEFKK